MRNTSIKLKGLFVILGAFVFNLPFGVVFSFSNFQLNIVTYMNNSSYPNYHLINQGQMLWIMGVMTLGMSTSLSLGQCLERKIGPSMTVLFGGWIMSFSTCLMCFTVKSYLSVIIISYGLIGGIGMGLASGVLLGTPAQWFPNKRGLVFGIVLSGCTLYGITFDRLQSKLITETNQNLPNSFVFLGSIYAGIQFLGSVMIKRPPHETSEDLEITSSSGKWETNEVSLTKNFHSINNVNEVDLEPHLIILELDFWILWIILFINSFWIYFITATYFNYFLFLVKVTEQSHYIHLISSLSGCFGRIFWGYLIDFVSFKSLMFIITLSSSVLLGILNLMPIIDNQILEYSFVVCIGAICFFNSGNFPIFPAMCAKLFGMKNFVFNYGMLFTSVSSAQIICTGVIVSFLEESDKFKNIEYRNIIYIGFALSLLAAMITLIFRGKSLITVKD